MRQLSEIPNLDNLILRVNESLKDPSFRAAFRLDPLQACRATFGPDAMPNQGEYFEIAPDGTLRVVFPEASAIEIAAIPDDYDYSELSDEMLEMVSGGSASYCCNPPPYVCNACAKS